MNELEQNNSVDDHDGIILTDVTKIYKVASQPVHALTGVSLSITPGSIIALTGKSGAGKSTLLHIIGTLDRPTSGSIKINGTEVSTLSDQALSTFRNATVGFVFQMNNLLPEFSALENVMMPGHIANAPKEMVRDRAHKLLKAVGLENRESHRPGELSGGEQQRVAIARALIMAPPLLLADEPTGNLDQRTSESIQHLLMDICQENNVTMILVTHDPQLAARLPLQIVMADGDVTNPTPVPSNADLPPPNHDTSGGSPLEV